MFLPLPKSISDANQLRIGKICEALPGSVTREERQNLAMSPDVMNWDIPLISPPTPQDVHNFTRPSCL